MPRFFASVLVAFAPVFVANLIFASGSGTSGASTIAFGANLLGAMLGGVLEYLAIITGYRALLFGVAILYGLAYPHGAPASADRGSRRAPEARVGADVP